MGLRVGLLQFNNSENLKTSAKHWYGPNLVDTIKQQLDELRQEIKEAKDRREKLFVDNDRAWEKVQDQINELEKQKTYLVKQQGESQPPESRKFCSCMAK